MRLHRSALSLFAIPVALAGLAALAVAAEEPAHKAREVLSALEAEASPEGEGEGEGAAAARAALAAAKEPIDHAKAALARAEELRKLGDVGRAEIAEDLALEWAETAREIVRASASEHEADVQAKSAGELEDAATRARKLLDEAIEKRAALEKELDALDRALEESALDGGTVPAKPEKKNGKKGESKKAAPAKKAPKQGEAK